MSATDLNAEMQRIIELQCQLLHARFDKRVERAATRILHVHLPHRQLLLSPSTDAPLRLNSQRVELSSEELADDIAKLVDFSRLNA